MDATSSAALAETTVAVPASTPALAVPVAPPPDASLDALWARLLETLRGEVRREQFETWFRRAALVRADAEVLVVAVHNRFTRDWLDTYYRDAFERAAASVLGTRRRVLFEIDPERAFVLTQEPEPAPPAVPRPNAAARSGPPGTPGATGSTASDLRATSLASDVLLNPHYRFDSFVVGPCNRFAHAASVGVGENPGRLYNPLFLHGSVGLGKTHLLQSLCHAILEKNPGARLLFLSCETFVNHFIRALEHGDLEAFRTKYRNVDLLVVDDIHLLANKERTQEEFFHTFNTLYNAGCQLVLSSDSPPVDIPTLQSRLVSRFRWGLVTEIEPPCYETRVAILKRKSRERGRELPDDVAQLLAEKIESNIRELEGAVTKLLGFASLSGQALSTALVRQSLRELFAASRRGQPTIDDVSRLVTEHFGVKLTDLQSKRRTNAIAYPRQVGMFLARRFTRMSLEEIGGYFGGRDHTTVIYGIDKILALSKTDPICQALLADLSTSLQRSL